MYFLPQSWFCSFSFSLIPSPSYLLFAQLPYGCSTWLAQGSCRAPLACQVDRLPHKPKADNHRSFSANYLLHTYERKPITKPKETHYLWKLKTKMKMSCWNNVSGPSMLVCPGEKMWHEDNRHLLSSSSHYVLRGDEDVLEERRTK